MSDKLQEALIALLPIFCGGFIGGFTSLVAIFLTEQQDRRRRKEERLLERRAHNIQKIEDYLDARISKIKSLTHPPININTLMEYLQAELWKDAGSSEAARASARFLDDKELANHLAELETTFLKTWDIQKQASEQQDLPELENMAIDIYHKCAGRVEILKRV